MAKTKNPPTDQKNTPETQKPLISENTKISIKIDQKTATAAYNKELKRLAVRVKHPGFRQGKVPAKIAEEVLGQSQIIEAALDKLLPQAYQEALVASKKQPITQPSLRPISLEVGKDWELEAEIAERPEIIVKDYEKITKKALKEATIELEKQVKEARAAHEKAQQEAKKATPSKTEPDSKEAAKPELQPFAEPSAEQRNDYLTQRVYQALITHLKPAIPELLVREEVRYDLDELRNQLEPLKMTIPEYMERRGITEQQLSNDLAARALGRLQITLLLQEIAKTAKLEVSQEAIDTAIEETKNPEMIAQKQNQQYRNLMEQTLLRKAVGEHLLSL